MTHKLGDPWRKGPLNKDPERDKIIKELDEKEKRPQ